VTLNQVGLAGVLVTKVNGLLETGREYGSR
jgi:hypothetical protein